MRIVAVVAILSVVFASDSEFLFKSEAEEETTLFKAPSSAESYLQLTPPSTFDWWTGFSDDDSGFNQNARGEWRYVQYVSPGYHGCGFYFLTDISSREKDNSGIKEICLILCSGRLRKYYAPLTDFNFPRHSVNIDPTKEKFVELLCDEESSIIQYSIRYQEFKSGVDNEGMTGIWFRCTKGADKEYYRDLGENQANWIQPARSWWSGSSHFVCGAKTKYLNWNNAYNHESRISLLDLAICKW